MQAADLLNIETRSQSALPFDAPDDTSMRTYSAPSASFRPTKIRSRTVPLDQVSENEELITMAGEAKVLSEEDGSSSDSDEIFTTRENEIVNYQSDSYSTNLDYFQSFTGKLVVDISNVCGLCTTETNPCYCSIEINKEFKAKTQPRHPSPFMKFDDKFDLDVQQAKSLSVRIFHEQTIFSDKCTASGYIVLEKLLGHERYKQCVLNFPKSNIQVSLNVKFTEARNYLMRRQSTKPTGVFGFNLSQTLVTEKNTIPILVRKCVAEIEERGLTQEGIYRISGNARKKKELRKQFEENSITTDVSDLSIDCHVITGILKDYLRELPKPLISQSMYKKIREGQQIKTDGLAQRKMLASIMKMAPPVNRATLIFVIEHLRRVNENIEVNKMGFKNLAVCFGPVLMSPPIEELKDIQKYVDALEFLLTIWPSETKQNML